MDTETAARLSKHMLRLAAETLTVVQTNPDLARIAEVGQNPDITTGELARLVDKAGRLSTYGSNRDDPKHSAASALMYALMCHWLAQNDPSEARGWIRAYPNMFALTQALESGLPYDANNPAELEAQESVKNVLITRCPAFAAAFTNG